MSHAPVIFGSHRTFQDVGLFDPQFKVLLDQVAQSASRFRAMEAMLEQVIARPWPEPKPGLWVPAVVIAAVASEVGPWQWAYEVAMADKDGEIVKDKEGEPVKVWENVLNWRELGNTEDAVNGGQKLVVGGTTFTPAHVGADGHEARVMLWMHLGEPWFWADIPLNEVECPKGSGGNGGGNGDDGGDDGDDGDNGDDGGHDDPNDPIPVDPDLPPPVPPPPNLEWCCCDGNWFLGTPQQCIEFTNNCSKPCGPHHKGDF